MLLIVRRRRILFARLVDMGVLDERDAACVRAAVFDQEDTEAPELERIIRARVTSRHSHADADAAAHGLEEGG